MMNGKKEREGLRDIETRNMDPHLSDIHGGFTGPSCQNGIFNRMPRNSRSLSYSDVSLLNEGSRELPATSWQRMKGLSQSICDLKILREKQMGRRQASCTLFEDDFLQEHAKKLQEARMKIRTLEAKYCSPERLRFNSNFSPTDRERSRASGTENGLPKNGSIINFKEGGRTLSSTEEKAGNDKTSEESVEDIEFTTKKVARRSLCNELSQLRPADDRSDIDSAMSTEEEAPRQPALMVNAKKTRKKKRRPLTWADGEDLCSSDTNSVSSYSSRRLCMEIIPERRDGESLCCLGYKDNHERPVLDDCDSNCSSPRKDDLILEPQRVQRRPIYYPGSQRDSGILNTPEKTKWRSVPNLSANPNYDHNQNNVQMMYGEAIPVDHNEDKKKHNTKFGRRSGFYVVNDCPEIIPQGPAPVLTTKKKMTFAKRLFHKNPSSKKNPSKCTAVISSPQQAQPLARVVGFHGTNEAAYVIELHRPAARAGSFGFSTQMGYRRYRKGIFISKIIDKKAAKFFGGLLQVGDEVVEIDNASVRDHNLASVNKLINNAEKLLITILPYVSRKD